MVSARLVVLRLTPLVSACAVLVAAGCGEVKIERRPKEQVEAAAPKHAPLERHLDSIRPLTTTGTNRQASFNNDATRIVWLCRPTATAEFSIRLMNADGGGAVPLDTGPGRRFGPAFAPDGRTILYAAAGPTDTLAPTPGADDPSGLWLFDSRIDLWLVGLDGTAPHPLTSTPGYDAEGSYSWGGTKIVFASLASDQGAIVLMNADGTGEQRVLAMPGYAGGPQISPDGSRIVFHAAAANGANSLEIYTADLGGGNLRRLTTLEGMSFCPVWHPSQQYIVFCSNAEERDFELFLIRPDGTGLERVTASPGFDGFPSFARDGRQIVWTSQRAGGPTAQTQIFRANWRG